MDNLFDSLLGPDSLQYEYVNKICYIDKSCLPPDAAKFYDSVILLDMQQKKGIEKYDKKESKMQEIKERADDSTEPQDDDNLGTSTNSNTIQNPLQPPVSLSQSTRL